MTEAIQQALNAASLGSIFALMALGLALIFGVMRLMNFAYGELLTVGAYLLILLRTFPWPVATVAMIAGTMVCALLMERIAFRPVRHAAPLIMMITSFALSFVIQNLIRMGFGPDARAVPVPRDLAGAIMVSGVRVSRLDMVTAVTTLALLIGLTFILKRTEFGMQIRAAAEDFGMARLLGVRADRVIAGAFAISGGLAAVASLLLVARTGSASPAMGLRPLLIALVATVIGGAGSLVGAVVGGFLLGVLTVGLQVTLPTDLTPYRDAFLFLFVIGVLLFRPQGIVSLRAAAERV